MFRFILLTSLILNSMVAFAQSEEYSCEAYTNDSVPQKLSGHISLHDRWVDGGYRVYFSNNKGGLEHRSYNFKVEGEITLKKIEAEIAGTGHEGFWIDEDQYQSGSREVTSEVDGRLSLVKKKHRKLGKGIIGEATVPFFNDNLPFLMKCSKVVRNDGWCWFGCN